MAGQEIRNNSRGETAEQSAGASAPGRSGQFHTDNTTLAVTGITQNADGTDNFNLFRAAIASKATSRDLGSQTPRPTTDYLSSKTGSAGSFSSSPIASLLNAVGSANATISYNNKTQQPNSSFAFSGSDYQLAGQISPNLSQLTYASPALQEFTRAYSNNRISMSQATLRYQDNSIQIFPTLVSAPINGVEISASTTVDQLFKIIQTGELTNRNLLSGTPQDRYSGLDLGETRALFNQYRFTNMPGASVLTLDILPKSDKGSVNLMIGTLPELGSFLGGRYRYEAAKLHGVDLTAEQQDVLSPRKREQMLQVYAQGDLLFVRTPDGTPQLAGELSFERTKGMSKDSLKVLLYKNLGMPSDYSTGFDQGLEFVFERSW
jgi:hypothetical protein